MNIIEKLRKQLQSNRKKTILKSIGVIILIGIIFLYFHESYGFLMSSEQKSNKINKILLKKDYEGARNYLEKYFKDTTDEKDKPLKELLKSSIDLCEQTNTDSYKEAMEYVDKLSKSMPKIIKTEIKNTYSSSRDYKDVEVTLKNNGDNSINYVKINIFFKDENGNVIRSEWFNDSSCIKPNTQQKVKHMVRNDGWNSVSVEVADWK